MLNARSPQAISDRVVIPILLGCARRRLVLLISASVLAACAAGNRQYALAPPPTDLVKGATPSGGVSAASIGRVGLSADQASDSSHSSLSPDGQGAPKPLATAIWVEPNAGPPSSVPEPDSNLLWSIKATSDISDGGNFATESPDRLSFNGKLAVPDLINFKFSGSSKDIWNSGGNEVLGMQTENSGKWKQGSLKETKLTLGFMDQRLQLTSRNSSSSFSTNNQTQEQIGTAQFNRVDAEILKSDQLSLGLFGSFARSSSDYHPASDFEVDKKIVKGNDNGFADPGHERVKVGGKFGLGAASFTLAGVSDSAFAGKGKGNRATAYEAKVTLNVAELRHEFGGLGSGKAWSVLPASLWASYKGGKVDVAGGRTRPDLTTDYSMGGSWQWSHANLNVSYWHSFYNMNQPGLEAYDWSGDGLDVSLGYQKPRWSVYAGLSTGRSNNYGPWGSVEDSHNAWLTASVHPDDWPKLTTTLNYYQYNGDFTGGVYGLNKWSATAELDLSQYLFRPSDYNSSLKLAFQVRPQGADSDWGGVHSANHRTDYFIGLRYDLIPNE